MSDEPLAGRVAIVTGSSRGMGRAIAGGLAAAGADVVINYRERATEAKAATDEVVALGRRSIAVQADVSSPADVARLIERCDGELGPPTMAQIETEMLRSATAADPSRIPVGRFGTVDEVAEVAVCWPPTGT